MASTTGGTIPRLLPGPLWDGLVVRAADDAGPDRFAFDLRTGVLVRERAHGAHPSLRTMRFASLASPDAMALRAEGRTAAAAGGPLLAPATDGEIDHGADGDVHWACVRSTSGGGIAAAAVEVDEVAEGRRCIERTAAYVRRTARTHRHRRVTRVRELAATGFDRLLREHRAAWARRWDDADVCIDGDAGAPAARSGSRCST